MEHDEQLRRLEAWVEAYVQAWNSDDPAAIGALFTEDAAYATEPYSPPGGDGPRSSAAGWTARTSPATPSSPGALWP